MKRTSLLLGTLLLSCAPYIWGQLAPLPIGPSGAAVNAGSLAASTAMTPVLTSWMWPAEPLLTDAAKEFSDQYEKRLVYYAMTIVDAGRIVRGEVTDLQMRVAALRIENEALGPFYPFSKRDNRTRLNQVETLLNHVRDQFLKLHTTGIYGERLNLNQNTRMSMEKLSRQLDEIESAIDKNKLINRLFK